MCCWCGAIRLCTYDDGGDASVTLSTARHTYRWKQPYDTSQPQDWRDSNTEETSTSIQAYRLQCQKQALSILECPSSPSSLQAFSPSPMWGPTKGNLLLSLNASVLWGVMMLPTNAEEGELVAVAPPLLQLLKICSSNFHSTAAKLLDVEYSLQSVLLDPTK